MGGSLSIPPSGASRDPEQWVRLLRRDAVTIWNSVPALMKMLVEHMAGRPGTDLQSLRLVLLSGDWIPVSLPARIRDLNDNLEIVSLGGATEASIWSIFHPIGEVRADWTSIPYGKPMANQSIHVLDDRLKDCPDDVTGELFIGGRGLAMGYWRNEEETDRRFITHPHSGERLYRTGDLGRYLPGGNVEILGRADFQIKIQGFRIELGEVETVLGRHETIRETVVVALG